MPQVIVQPAAGLEARRHFTNTIERSVPLTRIQPHMSEADYRRLAAFYDGDHVWVWGATPGVYSRWARIHTGDIVMFYRDKRFIRTAKVTFPCQNRALAIELWGRDPDGETWEYIYFVDDLQEADIAVQDFCAVVPYKSNFTPQGLMVLSQDKSDRVLEEYGLEGEGEGRKLEEFVDAIDIEPDRPSLVNVRGEQSILRRRLLRGRRVAPCSICGDDLPEDLLVAAHIKPRAECSREEKLDLPNIAMLMCKMGCDDLYEHGYLTVVDGMARTRRLAGDPPRLALSLANLEGRQCSAWNEGSREYFLWHEQNVHRGN